MADYDQNVSAINKVQRWKEFVSNVYARLNGAILYGLSTSSTEVPLLCSTAGNIHVELQASTESIGLLAGSTEVIGHVIADASTAIIGSISGITSTGGTPQLLMDSSGRVINSPATASWTPTDGHTNSLKGTQDSGANLQNITVARYLFNAGSTTWDRERNNHSITLLASTARSTDTVSSDQTNYNARAHVLFLDHTGTSTGASLTPSVQAKDSLSGLYRTIWQGAAVAYSTTLSAYMFGPDSSGSTGFTETAVLRLPRTWRLSVAHSSSGPTTYSASVDNLI